VDDDLGSPLDLLVARKGVELLAVPELPEQARATLIGQLHAIDRGQMLAEVRSDVASDPRVP
jgi:hypothetical protein